MTAPLETTNLVKHYFNICNTALASCSDRALYAAVVKLLEGVFADETITLRVTGTGEPRPPAYTTHFVDGQFMPVREGEHDPDARFELSQAFLEDVLEHADEYIEHPQKLDWSWVTGHTPD